MQQTLIKWKLKEVMARYDIKAIDLSKEMGVSSGSITTLRKGKTMPRMNGEVLNNLCLALNRLSGGKKIKLDELVEFVEDEA